MPWTLVRYCVRPPTSMFIMRRLPSRVRRHLLHSCRLCFIVSSMGVQMAVWSMSFPKKHPKTRICWPSGIIGMLFGIGWWSGLSFLVKVTASLCSHVPIRRMFVFDRLNLAPEAWHHVSRMVFRSWKLSCADR